MLLSGWLRMHIYMALLSAIFREKSLVQAIWQNPYVRYIGQEATDIYNSGLTLEEYFGVPGGDY